MRRTSLETRLSIEILHCPDKITNMDNDDPYERLSLHGTLPLIVDPDTGRLRFARPGRDAPDLCLSSPADLPEAEFQLFAFRQSGDLDLWSDGLKAGGGNAVELVTPEVRWPCFALLIRHGKAARDGETLEEVIPLRSVKDAVDAQTVARNGRETRRREFSQAREEEALAVRERDWAREIEVIEASGRIDYVRTPNDAASILRGTMQANGFRGLGPDVIFRRVGGGIQATWQPKLLRLRLPEGWMELWDEAVSRAGFEKADGSYSKVLDRLDGVSLDLLVDDIETVIGCDLEAAAPSP